MAGTKQERAYTETSIIIFGRQVTHSAQRFGSCGMTSSAAFSKLGLQHSSANSHSRKDEPIILANILGLDVTKIEEVENTAGTKAGMAAKRIVRFRSPRCNPWLGDSFWHHILAASKLAN